MGKPEHYLAVPQRGSGRGVLVLHAWWGLNDFFRDLCDRLAAEGFVALAPDLFGGKTATTVAGARRLRAAATKSRREPIYRFISREIEFLQNHDAVRGATIGVLGFSWEDTGRCGSRDGRSSRLQRPWHSTLHAAAISR